MPSSQQQLAPRRGVPPDAFTLRPWTPPSQPADSQRPPDCRCGNGDRPAAVQVETRGGGDPLTEPKVAGSPPKWKPVVAALGALGSVSGLCHWVTGASWGSGLLLLVAAAAV